VQEALRMEREALQKYTDAIKALSNFVLREKSPR
jgi:hypothetical protein